MGIVAEKYGDDDDEEDSEPSEDEDSEGILAAVRSFLLLTLR